MNKTVELETYETGGLTHQISPNQQRPIQKYRLLVQSAFSSLCIWIGVEFFLFVKYIETTGVSGSAYRPPGVDGFLPISSLMSLYYYFKTGVVHTAHPAGLFILVAILVVSLVFGKSFCSWLCPAGLISELVGDVGEKLLGRKVILPRWLDYPLRSLKYLLLGFFVYSIFFLMTTAALKTFLDTPYNLLADVKMYYFFAEISQFALIVLISLVILSVVVRNFWCRFLCPYGALLGVFSLISPHKIKRNPVTCIDCGSCALACPSRIKVNKVKTVYSDECTACMNCLDVCPVSDTLNLHSTIARRPVSKKLVAVGVAGLFMLITGLGMATGYWQNDIPVHQYIEQRERVKMYGHPTGTSEIEHLNKQSELQQPPSKK
jgi:polyferredoxin